MTTVRELLSSSLRLLRVVADGEPPSNENITIAFDAANDLLDTWSLRSLFVFHTPRLIFPMQGGKALYTIGAGGDWDTPRPDRIERVTWRDKATGLELPMRKQTDEEFRTIAVRTTRSNRPYAIYLEEDYPLIKATIYPVPTLADEVVLYPWARLAAFDSLDDEISFPTGYQGALRWNIAIWIAPWRGITVSTEMAQIAAEQRELITVNNTSNEVLKHPRGMPRGRRGRGGAYSHLFGRVVY